MNRFARALATGSAQVEALATPIRNPNFARVPTGTKAESLARELIGRNQARRPRNAEFFVLPAITSRMPGLDIFDGILMLIRPHELEDPARHGDSI